MLSKEQVQVLIVLRMQAATESYNSHHVNHIEGQLRALCAVINDGVAPPATGDALVFFEAAGIPYDLNEDQTYGIPLKWCEERGIVLKSNRFTHPFFDQLRY